MDATARYDMMKYVSVCARVYYSAREMRSSLTFADAAMGSTGAPGAPQSQPHDDGPAAAAGASCKASKKIRSGGMEGCEMESRRDRD